MKARNKISLCVGISIAIVVLFSTSMIYFNNNGTTLESSYNNDPSAVLAHCAQQKYGEENDWKTPDGKNFLVTSVGLYAMNETHYIDNNLCTWIERPPGLNTMLSGDELKFYKQKLANDKNKVIELFRSTPEGGYYPDHLEEIEGYAIDFDGDVMHLPFADICTDEMKIILLTHSNIASPDEEFVMEDVDLPFGMNQEDFERCAHETSFTKSRWNMITMENPEPVPIKCKSGPAPSEKYYFDNDTCEWKEIENEN